MARVATAVSAADNAFKVGLPHGKINRFVDENVPPAPMLTRYRAPLRAVSSAVCDYLFSLGRRTDPYGTPRKHPGGYRASTGPCGRLITEDLQTLRGTPRYFAYMRAHRKRARREAAGYGARRSAGGSPVRRRATARRCGGVQGSSVPRTAATVRRSDISAESGHPRGSL